MSDVIRFVMDGDIRELRGVDPTRTVLNLLRYDLKRTGTKEGCAEGDCGACTVALGRLEGESVRYEAVNACILFAPVLDGKELVTVEGLAPKTAGHDGALHPVQQAMVDRHGSQCGFCTPGFVMSLFALHEGPAETTPDPADVLAGNLCRCTGYGPILAAGRDVLAGRAAGPRRASPEVVGLLKTLAARRETLALDYRDPLTGAGRRWFSPRTTDELAMLAAQHPDATLLSGATDVGLWVTKQHRALGAVIYTGEVAELAQVEDKGDHLRIGAGARYVDAAAALGELFPDFGEVIRRIGSVQIRNSGTIGGNIANGSPIGDSPPPLIALGARLVLRFGELRREIALEDFFLAYGEQDRRPGEIVEAVLVPKPAPGRLLRAYKISKRFDQDISALLGAFSLNITEGAVTDARVAFGGMAATPKRATACEAALVGAPWTQETIEAACAALAGDFAPISDMRASASYRIQAAQNLLRKVFLESSDAAPPTRLVGDHALGAHAHG